jgi:hypothetical protein
METVKVDIQKLQLLNDRVAQTIDALNQVRMSVGIQHSPAQVAPWGYAGGYGTYPTQSFGVFAPYGQPSFAQFGQPYGQPSYAQYGQPSFAQPSFAQPSFAQPSFAQYGQPYGLPLTQSPYATPIAAGIQHTSVPFTGAWAAPWGTSTPWASLSSPYGIQPASSSIASPLGTWSMPYVGNGISHTTWDPSWQLRAMNPFVQTAWPVSIS